MLWQTRTATASVNHNFFCPLLVLLVRWPVSATTVLPLRKINLIRNYELKRGYYDFYVVITNFEIRLIRNGPLRKIKLRQAHYSCTTWLHHPMQLVILNPPWPLRDTIQLALCAVRPVTF